MPFVSYAQNFEDVMLWRALNHVVKGFYVDVGANDPVVDSVSLAFYKRGWRGVSVEPSSEFAALLKRARPDETVEEVAIGTNEGNVTLYEVPGTGLSTTDSAIARQHDTNGIRYTKRTVSVISLDTLFRRIGDRPIHWLKIDVEGFERSVLESWNDSSARPWILLIESTRPGSQVTTHSEWEPLVLSKGYVFAYFDGLNRFYVHQDRPELLPAFSSPPNAFDGFELSGTANHSFWRHIVSTIHATPSWRITQPIRSIQGFLARRLRNDH